MSVRDVSQLRRDGRYIEALRMAWQEWEDDDNEWTEMSLFWSMHHYCKNVLIPNGHKDIAKKFLPQMEALLPTMIDDDGIGEKAFQILHNRLQPHAEAVRRCSSIAKDNPVQAYNELSAIPLAEIDDSMHESCGWIYFWYLKAKVSANTDGSELPEINALLDTYLRLHCERPSRLHSLVLFMVIRYAKKHQNFDFMAFFKLWNPDNLRDEDWKRRSAPDAEGKQREYNSLAEDCAALCFKAIKPDCDKQTKEWLMSFYGKVSQKHPSDDNCMRNYAKLCALSGEVDKARDIYSKIVLPAGNKYYVWYEYACLIEEHHVDIKIGLLLKALETEKNEDFLGNIHLSLADAFIKEGLFSKASSELETMSSHYREMCWRIPGRYYTLEQLCNGRQDTKSFDRNRYLEVADELVYSSLPLKYGVIAYINKEKKVLHILSPKSNMLFRKYRKTRLKTGDFVAFRTYEPSGDAKAKILTLRSATRMEALPCFESCQVAVDNVNEGKSLFHIVGLGKIKSRNVLFSETEIRPGVGDVLNVIYAADDKGRVNILDIGKNDAGNIRLSREIEGTLQLKVRGGGHVAVARDDDETFYSTDADFGFVAGCYVHARVLRRHKIADMSTVVAKMVIDGDGRWNVYDIKRKG